MKKLFTLVLLFVTMTVGAQQFKGYNQFKVNQGRYDNYVIGTSFAMVGASFLFDKPSNILIPLAMSVGAYATIERSDKLINWLGGTMAVFGVGELMFTFNPDRKTVTRDLLLIGGGIILMEVDFYKTKLYCTGNTVGLKYNF